jgi:hypothetical protein
VERVAALPWFRDRLEVERKATDIRTYEPYQVPGLLQTENYARANVTADRPMLSDDEIERAVALRISRQEMLMEDGDSPNLWAIMDEAVITTKNESSLVYLEDIGSARYVRDRQEVRRYMVVFDHLRASALTDRDSVKLIKG